MNARLTSVAAGMSFSMVSTAQRFLQDLLFILTLHVPARKQVRTCLQTKVGGIAYSCGNLLVFFVFLYTLVSSVKPTSKLALLILDNNYSFMSLCYLI